MKFAFGMTVIRYISQKLGMIYVGNIVRFFSEYKQAKDPKNALKQIQKRSEDVRARMSVLQPALVRGASLPSRIVRPAHCQFHLSCTHLVCTTKHIEKSHENRTKCCLPLKVWNTTIRQIYQQFQITFCSKFDAKKKKIRKSVVFFFLPIMMPFLCLTVEKDLV